MTACETCAPNTSVGFYHIITRTQDHLDEDKPHVTYKHNNRTRVQVKCRIDEMDEMSGDCRNAVKMTNGQLENQDYPNDILWESEIEIPQ